MEKGKKKKKFMLTSLGSAHEKRIVIRQREKTAMLLVKEHGLRKRVSQEQKMCSGFVGYQIQHTGDKTERIGVKGGEGRWRDWGRHQETFKGRMASPEKKQRRRRFAQGVARLLSPRAGKKKRTRKQGKGGEPRGEKAYMRTGQGVRNRGYR